MTGFTVRNPAFETRVRDSFSRQRFMATLGATLVSVGPGSVEIMLDHRDELTQQHGFFHGGVIGTLADNACGYAAFSLMAAEDSVLTVEYKMNLLAPGKGERLIARGTVVRPGRTITTSEAKVFSIIGGTEKLVATALGTLMCMTGMSDDRQN